MTVWSRTCSAPVRRSMGAVVVHNVDDEPVLLREALVLVWDALGHGCRSEAEVAEAVFASTDGEPPVDAVHQGLEALRQVGLATCE